MPLRVLLSAYSCEPGRGSEPGTGWNTAVQAARYHDTWVLTPHSNREAIERAHRRGQGPNINWVWVSFPCGGRTWPGPLGRFRYSIWQFAAFLAARRLQSRIAFDIVHHVTWSNYWLPIFTPFLRGAFVWGPVGGGESAPISLRGFLPLSQRLSERLRDLARGSALINPVVRLTARRARCSLAATPETLTVLQRLGTREATVACNALLPSDELERLGSLPVPPERPPRFITLSRLLGWKGTRLALRAFAEHRRSCPESEYWVVGDGPDRAGLERVANRLGLERSVKFWGSLPRDRALQSLAQCHVLVHPSLHDSGGWALLEAQAAGRPVICLNLGGPGYMVTPETGVKVGAASSRVVEELAAAMTRLAGDPELRRTMGQAGRGRVEREFNWDRRGELLREIYAQAAGRRT